METLRGVFPAVPTTALLRVLEICDHSVALASTWLLENDWEELMEDEEEDEEGTNVTADLPTGINNVVTEVNQVTPTPAPLAAGNRPVQERVFYARRSSTARNQDQVYPPRRAAVTFDVDSEDEDGDEGDEVDDDEDEDEEDMYYDSGDEALLRGGGLPPSTKRVKVTKAEDCNPAPDEFWVAFDDLVVPKNMIELLNTTLSKLAHNKVTLLNQSTKELDEATATVKLRSVLSTEESVAAGDEALGGAGSSLDKSTRSDKKAADSREDGSVSVDLRPKETESPSYASESPSTATQEVSTGQKRKRQEVVADQPAQGFFAHFFPVSDLDMVWRSVMHAHLFKSRFGEKIEFHTASIGARRDFDEMTHMHTLVSSSRAASLGFSPFSNLKCCLVLPCGNDEDEMLRVGRNLYTIMKLQGSLYYGTIDQGGTVSRRDNLDLVSDDENMTEERFRRFARYRVKKEEEAPADDSKENKITMDPYMGYHQPRQESYCLQYLDGGRWISRTSN